MLANEFKERYIDPKTDKQLQEYEESVKAYRDIVNAVNTARIEGQQEGRKQGLTEGKFEIARKMKEKGFSIQDIADMTDLSPATIEEL